MITHVEAAPPEPSRPPRRWHWLLLAMGWTVFAVYGSLVPLKYQEVPFEDAIERFRNLPPLWAGMGARADWVANILLFVPLTFFWMAALVAERGRVATFLAAALVAPAAIASAVALEFSQIWFAGRTVSRNDILAETIGGSVGIAAWMLIGPVVIRAWRAYAADRDPRSTLRRLLGLYVVGFAIFAVIPLDLTVSFTDLYGKYKRGLVLLVPFSYGYESPMAVAYQFFADIATFVPVGAWVAVTGWSRLPFRSAFARGAIGGGLVALAMEGAQLLVLSRFTDVTDIFLGTIGSGIGAALVIRSGQPATQPRSSEASSGSGHVARRIGPWVALTLLYSLFLAAGFLYPFDWTTDRSVIRPRFEAFFRVPFLALYLGSEFNALKQVLVRLLLFAPLGIAIARMVSLVRPPAGRVIVALVGLAYAAGVGILLEAAQIFMPSKIADLTEVVICLLGVAAGFVMGRRVFTTSDGVMARGTKLREMPPVWHTRRR